MYIAGYYLSTTFYSTDVDDHLERITMTYRVPVEATLWYHVMSVGTTAWVPVGKIRWSVSLEGDHRGEAIPVR